MISQLAAPATRAAVTPISRTATSPTSPRPAHRAEPSRAERAAGELREEPDDHGGQRAGDQAPQRRGLKDGVGAIRTVIRPASTPARYGVTSTKKPSQAGNAACPPRAYREHREGRHHAERGADGETAVPTPNENPGPSMYAIAQITEFGR